MHRVGSVILLVAIALTDCAASSNHDVDLKSEDEELACLLQTSLSFAPAPLTSRSHVKPAASHNHGQQKDLTSLLARKLWTKKPNNAILNFSSTVGRELAKMNVFTKEVASARGLWLNISNEAPHQEFRSVDILKRSSSNSGQNSLDVDQSEWLRLTRLLFQTNRMPFPIHGVTTLREGLNRWNQKIGNTLISTPCRCAETGDGHFLNDFPNCASRLSLDFYDGNAQVKLNLDLPPIEASPDVKQAQGTIDLLVSHQVFEHLRRPEIGMANLNVMLKEGGLLVFSTPFVVQDHSSPNDYFRYTVQNVRRLLGCGGFHVEELYGYGNEMISLAYLAQVGADQLSESDLDGMCDANKQNDCRDTYYSMVLAIGRKIENKISSDIQDCF